MTLGTNKRDSFGEQTDICEVTKPTRQGDKNMK